MVDKTHAHCVYERVPLVALVEHHFAADCRNPDTVTVSCDTGDDVLEQVLHAIVLQFTETQGVQ
ncbi:hypothetical protein D3C84_1130060 [compost metagenome]